MVTGGGDRPRAAFGIGGLNCRQTVGAGEHACFGVAGNLNRALREEDGLVDVGAFRRRDAHFAGVSPESRRLGDRAACEGWQYGVWFADYTYIVTPYEPTDAGGHVLRPGGEIGWRRGRERVFGRDSRALPVYLDSCGYRREITGTAPRWTRDFETYPAAIELIEPDGYAWYDFPGDRERTLEHGRRLMALFPDDVHNGRQWPVFSIRWTWDDRVCLAAARLPGWRSAGLASLIPLTRTQRPFRRDTRERWARLAIANALITAADPDFRWMVNTFGRVMLGGMVGSKCPRMARHLYLATLCHLFPGILFWGLGQASAVVVNGLGTLGLLDRVWLDGTWWLLDATADRFAVVEGGLITMLSLEGRARSFFTLVEAMAANLRSLLAAYAGLWAWPPPEPLPVDLMDPEQAAEMKRRLETNVRQLRLRFKYGGV